MQDPSGVGEDRAELREILDRRQDWSAGPVSWVGEGVGREREERSDDRNVASTTGTRNVLHIVLRYSLTASPHHPHPHPHPPVVTLVSTPP